MSGVCAFENPVHEVCGASIHSRKVFPVGHQTASQRPLFLIEHARQPLLYCEINDLLFCWIANASCKTRNAWGRSSAIAANAAAKSFTPCTSWDWSVTPIPSAAPCVSFQDNTSPGLSEFQST